ncbi:MAG: hypothetical protein AAFS02_11140 [Pseudomonadota bacterium]
MNDQDDALDQALAKLDDRIEPERDLWPGIEAKISERKGGFWQWRVAASVFAASVLVGLLIIPPDDATTTVAGVTPSEVPEADEALFRYSGLDAEFVRVHQRSLDELADHLADLQPATREVVIANLKIIRASIAEINEAIEREPNNVELRQLLRMAYEQELAIVNGFRRSAPTLERTTT